MSKQNSTTRIVLSSLLLAWLVNVHFAILFQLSMAWFWMLLTVGFYFHLQKKGNVKKYTYKTASIICFLYPLSILFFSMLQAGQAVIDAGGDEAAEAGAAIGGVIGGAFLTGYALVIGGMLGIVFNLMSKSDE